MYTLHNWSTNLSSADPYKAPEQCSTRLKGNVYGHPKFNDGDLITTSTINKIEGRIITTDSGSVYRLGRPSQKWLHWLKQEGYVYDPKNPVKDMRK